MTKLFLTVLSALLISNSALADDRIYELRTYYANEGKLDALHARFRDHTVGLFEKHGMTNVGYWVPQNNKSNTLVYLMAYPDRAARDASWKAFMGDPDWKKAYAESTKDGKLVKKVDNQFLKTTDYSPDLKIEKKDPARLFELRIYTTNDDKLKNLNARFRDHTVELFEKHGLENIIYLNFVEGEKGAKNQLVYFIAHKDEDVKKANFKKFGSDPDWGKARADSEKDGKILVQNGVSSTLLVPTDYSPLK